MGKCPFSSYCKYRLLTAHSYTPFQELPSLMEAALPPKAPVDTLQDFWWPACSKGNRFAVHSWSTAAHGMGRLQLGSCLCFLPFAVLVTTFSYSFSWEPPIIAHKGLCLRVCFCESQPETTALLCSRHTQQVPVADHSNKSNITINWFTWIFCFPVHKLYLHTILLVIFTLY